MWRMIPWKFILKRLSHAHGFIDPIQLLRQFNRFASKAELVAPTELLKAGAAMHARGIINSQAFQHNLDWVWPYWVECQFNPRSSSFVPRAFSISQINLTHRNWTAVGVPGFFELPIVDPRGLVTPLFDGWSIDAWVIPAAGDALLPSIEEKAEQTIVYEENLRIITRFKKNGILLATTVEVDLLSGAPVTRIGLVAECTGDALLAVALRPYNPEGVSLINRVARTAQPAGWIVNRRDHVTFHPEPQAILFSQYVDGDVFSRIGDPRVLREKIYPHDEQIDCEVGMATAAALFEIKPNEPRSVTVSIPLRGKSHAAPPGPSLNHSAEAIWQKSLSGTAKIALPDAKMQFLFENALRTVILHAPEDVYAGPFTYKRFWFRDAAIIVYAMITAGFIEKAKSIIDRMPHRQTPFGHFLSQEGEWDSNGQVLWVMNQLCELGHLEPPEEWRTAITRGADWIRRKRHSHKTTEPFVGLLPAGFSAEHLGPNDHYYWDNFWSAAGLYAAAKLMARYGDSEKEALFRREGDDLCAAIERSVRSVVQRLGREIFPASPSRRMDSGAVGSLVGGYPLQLYRADDARLNATADYLLENCMIGNALFHDISHSGINVYLTLHIAQTLLRKGDPRYISLVNAVRDLASPAGQWPEAIHPWLGTGCMGDGQHVWAAAEWLLMMRNCFVRDEQHDGTLIFFSGIQRQWCTEGAWLFFGPAPTPYGTVSLAASVLHNALTLSWEAKWHTTPSKLAIALPWRAAQTVEGSVSSVTVDLEEK